MSRLQMLLAASLAGAVFLGSTTLFLTRSGQAAALVFVTALIVLPVILRVMLEIPAMRGVERWMMRSRYFQMGAVGLVLFALVLGALSSLDTGTGVLGGVLVGQVSLLWAVGIPVAVLGLVGAVVIFKYQALRRGPAFRYGAAFLGAGALILLLVRISAF